MATKLPILANLIFQVIEEAFPHFGLKLQGYYMKHRGLVRQCVIRFLEKCWDVEHLVVYVNPNDIVFTVSRNDPTLIGNGVSHFGSTNSGNWDLNGYRVREYWDVYKILKQRVENKLQYNEIPEFVEILRKITDGQTWYNCKTKQECFRRWQRTEKLYWAIKRNGYRTQDELETEDRFNEIRIQIGRKGDLLFEEGFHRLVISQLLDLEQVPVVIYRRHKEWAKLRGAVKKVVQTRGFFHQPFNHPDLDILPQIYGNHLKDQAFYGNERWEYILNSLPQKRGTVLDIGAYFGYFSHRFEDLGFECFAVENNKMNLQVLKHYRKMKGKRFVVWETSVFDIGSFEFDIVLALNIFHHLVKTKHHYDKLVQFLRRLRCKAMYFEPARKEGQEIYRRFSDQEFIDFVISHTTLKYSRMLGRAREGRNVYLLTE
jgi:2-polyprenyl-3-methyl-5-hydroxy-6-metoxy-1,4-benzoquinol methylase